MLNIWLPHSFIWYKRLQANNNPGVEGSAIKSQARLSSKSMRVSMNVHVCVAVVMTNVPNKSHHRTRQHINEDNVSYYFCLFLIKAFTGDITCGMYFDSQQSTRFAKRYYTEKHK